MATLVGWALTRSPVFRVHRVLVVGNQHVTASEVLRAAGLAGRPQMVDLHPARMARAVEALPWIGTVRVQRHWPTGVTLIVTERRPVAVVADTHGGSALVDQTGRVLALVGVVPPGVPAVREATPPGTTPVQAGDPGTMVPGDLGVGLGVAADLVSPLTSEVAAVTVVAGGEVDLSLIGGGTAVLGGPDELPAKLTALATVLGKIKVGRATIDVRVPTAPVLTGP